jgi:hypothetical protein
MSRPLPSPIRQAAHGERTLILHGLAILRPSNQPGAAVYFLMTPSITNSRGEPPGPR